MFIETVGAVTIFNYKSFKKYFYELYLFQKPMFVTQSQHVTDLKKLGTKWCCKRNSEGLT